MKLFRLTGHARRRQLLAVTLLLLALALLLAWLQDSPYWQWSRFALAALILTAIAGLTTLVRRLHDIGRSGAWAMLALVPVLGQLLVVLLLFWPPAGRKRIGNGRAAAPAAALLLVVALFGFSRIFWQPIWVTSESMKPALLVGDYLALGHIAPQDLQRGDIISFRHAARKDIQISRLIGLPGDRIQIRSGLVWLNGQLLTQTAAGIFEERMAAQGPLRLRPRCQGGPVGNGGFCRKSRLTETIPADAQGKERKFDVLNIENGAYADDTPSLTVPQGTYFVLGDNRDNSMDSRYPLSVGGMGFVPADNIIGRAGTVLISAAGDQLWKFWTWRGDRVLKGVE